MRRSKSPIFNGIRRTCVQITRKWYVKALL